MGLDGFFVGLAYFLEYLFAAVTTAGTRMTNSAGTGMLEHPTIMGVSLAGGGTLSFVVVYTMIRSYKRAMQNIGVFLGSFLALSMVVSLGLVSYSPSTIPIVLNSTNATALLLNATLATASVAT